MTYTAPVLGLLAGVAGIADVIPYVRDTVRGSTRPHRGTWLIWAILAGGGVIGWIVVDAPVVATACVVAADLIGAAMMVPKTYRDPRSETLATFELASLCGALAAGAVAVPDPSLLLHRPTTAWRTARSRSSSAIAGSCSRASSPHQLRSAKFPWLDRAV